MSLPKDSPRCADERCPQREQCARFKTRNDPGAFKINPTMNSTNGKCFYFVRVEIEKEVKFG